tara:strand:+ start:675 stop:1073 length:399 start_codon:yes stop_codon:yes gene_type:complete
VESPAQPRKTPSEYENPGLVAFLKRLDLAQHEKVMDISAINHNLCLFFCLPMTARPLLSMCSYMLTCCGISQIFLACGYMEVAHMSYMTGEELQGMGIDSAEHREKIMNALNTHFGRVHFSSCNLQLTRTGE